MPSVSDSASLFGLLALGVISIAETESSPFLSFPEYAPVVGFNFGLTSLSQISMKLSTARAFLNFLEKVDFSQVRLLGDLALGSPLLNLNYRDKIIRQDMSVYVWVVWVVLWP